MTDFKYTGLTPQCEAVTPDGPNAGRRCRYQSKVEINGHRFCRRHEKEAAKGNVIIWEEETDDTTP